MNKRILFALGLVGVLIVLPLASQPQQKQQRPPEYELFRKALRIQDLTERMASLEKLLKDYPETQYKTNIENSIIHARIGLSDSLDEVLKLQSGLMEGSEGMNKVAMCYTLAQELLSHEKLDRFDPGRVTAAVKDYVDEGIKIVNDPEVAASIPERQRSTVDFFKQNLQLFLAQAYLHNDKLAESKQSLKTYSDEGGATNKSYHYMRAQIYEQEGNAQQAFEGYFEAAVENHQDSAERARQMYRKLNGSLEGFDDKLAAKQRELPFHPPAFAPEDTWQGKVVLAELFTGAQCPPCVAADLGFDGLIDAFDTNHVAVLEYHLHIPGPDPLTNHASTARAAFYQVRSTPSTLFDGKSRHSGGGDRSRGEMKFEQYNKTILSRIYDAPETKLNVEATLDGDTVLITFGVDKAVSGAEYYMALVQDEARYAGSNGIVFHKMVVREFMTVDPKAQAIKLSITKAEEAAARHIEEFEKERGYTFEEKHHKIDKAQLHVVFFAQHPESKAVYNASVCRVK